MPTTTETTCGTTLPAGTTCGDCAHIRRCSAMFGHDATDTYCDWAPSRFRPHPTASQEPQP
ncbi:hypothetical protein [Azospirillum agricola]|uniref:hypothetical protein n=1 Tax=Azospirillum agricola TaxID=1720247 RepID=UPI000A0EF38F|nr:hypothetical protein [Azospirillum agricola]SMH60469.1 hypothetical protein SAMN02982994_5512 [Azospirillum lipoferum]